ncbi:MAG: diaminopimelate epimerase [Bdellovibrionia bacterium]
MRAELLHNFAKYSGAGNSFVIAACSEKNATTGKLSQLAKKICSRESGLGADGFLVLIPTLNKDEFTWDFYNSDGSVAEMCGNAARCAALYISNQQKSANKKIQFNTLAGTVRTELAAESLITVEMTPLVGGDVEQLTIEGKEISFFRVNTGVPHVVIDLGAEFRPEPLKNMAAILRAHKHFGNAGTNVTLVQKIRTDEVKAVTYERGVEDFTLACGTGAVAAAAFNKHSSGAMKTTVEMPGGTLIVEFGSANEQPRMMGPAIEICKFEWKAQDE